MNLLDLARYHLHGRRYWKALRCFYRYLQKKR